MINFQNSEFVASAVSSEGFPKDGRPQIVFAGRSNVGKSSLINRLLNRKNLARVSSSPGKTANINLYNIDSKLWFIDLPGYGYAKVGRDEKERWGVLMETYFDVSDICGALLVVDIRHKPTDDDLMMASFFAQKQIPFVVVENKCDKLNKTELSNAVKLMDEIEEFQYAVKRIPFSAEKGIARDEVINEIISFLGN